MMGSESEMLKNVDWKLLAHQKKVLVEIRSRITEEYDAVSGIIHLIDHIQDYAHDKLNLPVVFLTEEDDLG